MRRVLGARSLAGIPLASISMLLLAGCVGDEGEPVAPDPPALLHEYDTEHLRIHSDVERCEGDLARWDGFVGFAQDYLGVEAPGIVDVYVWDDAAFDDVQWCGRPMLGGCFPGEGVVYGEVTSLEHELVHAITEDFANHDRFFVEGLAEALAEDTAFGMFPPSFHATSSSEVDYPSAGHFVRWLLESAGPAAFVEYMSRADAGLDDLQSIYGEYVGQDVEAAFYAEADDAYPRAYEHPAPELEYDASLGWSSELIFDCAHEDVRGRAEGRVVVRDWIVEEPGFYALWASVEGRVELRRRFVSPPELGFFSAGMIVGRTFEPGTYEVSVVAAPGTQSGTLRIWLNPASVPTWPTEPP